MEYFYHLVPDPFVGKDLIPLNEMDRESKLYKSHSRKYIGRESLTEQTIPLLNCKWNDVIQFSSVHPQLIIDKLREIQPDFKLYRTKCFKVSVLEVEGKYEGVIFDRNKTQKKGDFSIHADDIRPLNSTQYKELTHLPKETIAFWNRVKEEGGKYLWFPYIPHIFLKGIVDTTHFEVIDLY
ncbi:hypothetical protein [Halobacteriovorax marinus]|uniref:hypothetical protein n=1 Tax=Halobacteriovorax marinus TaxID=97084 RepID=UPI003A920AF2